VAILLRLALKKDEHLTMTAVLVFCGAVQDLRGVLLWCSRAPPKFSASKSSRRLGPRGTSFAIRAFDSG
jgi:hypothetical protein